ncbi:MAG: GIY-YIG nuclease family protein [Actinobacteria bacterium]|nr:GIY-YIG nuclease family protein [Actinomycetota bacterium]
MNAHFVYIIKCRDGTFYTGYTMDLSRRLGEHNRGEGAKYTRGRAPVELVYWEEHQDWGSALRREIQLKKMKRAQKAKLVGVTS